MIPKENKNLPRWYNLAAILIAVMIVPVRGQEPSQAQAREMAGADQIRQLPEHLQRQIAELERELELRNGIPEGFVVIEGDILMPEGEVEFGDNCGDSAFGPPAKWPGGIVPYWFSSNVNPTRQFNFKVAMNEWRNAAHLSFLPWNGQANFICVQASTSDNSQVGMVGGAQTINILSWDSWPIMAHELSHALGFWHEQSRPDRDAYVVIQCNVVLPGKKANFKRHPDAWMAGSLSTAYDYDSVMHYGKCAWSLAPTLCDPTDFDTISLWTIQTLFDIGQRVALSISDIADMANVYGSGRVEHVDLNSTLSGNGGVSKPWIAIQLATNSFVGGAGQIIWMGGSANGSVVTGTFDRPAEWRAWETVTLGQ